MRYRLMIVDPDRGICENIPYLLDWSQYGVSGILTANSYEEAVSRAVDFQPHIALVELELGDRQGYELVRHLRETGLETVFCTMGDKEDFQWVQQSMRAGARDYLLKPLDSARFKQTMNRVLCSLEQRTAEDIVIQRGTGCEVVLLSDIVYCEVLGRKIYLHKSDGTVSDYYDKLEDLERRVDGRFFKCHRSYLVNLDYVRGCQDGQVLLFQGERIPASRLRERELMQALLRYMKERGI